MEESDIELIRKLLPNDEELRRLWTEHLDLEKKLEQYNKKHYLSSEEEMIIR